MLAPCEYRSGLAFSLIKHVGIDQRDQRRADDGDEEEPEGSHAAKERANEGEHAGDHEQDRTDTVSFIPNPVAGQRPRGADAYKEVALGLAEHIADEEEQDAHGRQHGFAHTKVGVAKIPAQRQSVDIEHERNDQHDEQVERIAELGNIRFERVDIRDDQEQ